MYKKHCTPQKKKKIYSKIALKTRRILLHARRTISLQIEQKCTFRNYNTIIFSKLIKNRYPSAGDFRLCYVENRRT